jgi:hypothetical protein
LEGNKDDLVQQYDDIKAEYTAALHTAVDNTETKLSSRINTISDQLSRAKNTAAM